jgi:hypothetical protein
MVPVLGNGPATGEERSVRAFDPVSNAWEYLWPNGQGGLQNRDNYASLYIPQLDEIWVWGGSYLEAVPGALRSGRFSIAQRKWISTGTTDNGASVPARGQASTSRRGCRPQPHNVTTQRAAC